MIGRIFAFHWSVYIVAVFGYLIIFVLYVIFRNEQPLKSRFVAPYISLIAIAMNLFGEYLYGYLTYEESTKFFCLVTAFLNYSVLQISYVLFNSKLIYLLPKIFNSCFNDDSLFNFVTISSSKKKIHSKMEKI